MRRFFHGAAFVALLSTSAVAQTPPQLPAGEGRDIVAVACSQCHQLNAITNMRKGAAGWRAHVYDENLEKPFGALLRIGFVQLGELLCEAFHLAALQRRDTGHLGGQRLLKLRKVSS